MTTLVRFKKPGSYAHKNPKTPHLQVPARALEQVVTEDMREQCEKFGWAEPVLVTPLDESGDPVAPAVEPPLTEEETRPAWLEGLLGNVTGKQPASGAAPEVAPTPEDAPESPESPEVAPEVKAKPPGKGKGKDPQKATESALE